MWYIIAGIIFGVAVLFCLYLLRGYYMHGKLEKKVFEAHIENEKKPDEVVLELGGKSVYFEGKYMVGCDPYNGNPGCDSGFDIYRVYIYVDHNDNGGVGKVYITEWLSLLEGLEVDYAVLQEKIAKEFESCHVRWSEN